MLLLLATAALAHRPHAVVSALTTGADYQARGRAWLVFAPGDATVLLRTDDFGAHWSVVGGAPQGDAIVDLAERDGALYALAADGTVWMSPDEGGTWAAHEPTGSAATSMAVGASGLAIATSTGAWVGDPVGGMTRGTDVPLAEIAWSASGDALLARTDDGGLLRSVDAGRTFETLTVPAAITAVAEVDGVPYVGTSEGAFRWDGAWTACAELPDADAVMPGLVTELVAHADGTLYAVTATDAYFVSDDGCQSWDTVPTGLSASFGGIGGVAAIDQTYVAVVVGERHQLVAGFDGVAHSHDHGETWATAPVVSIDRTRGLDFAASFPAEPRLFVGTYGGGVGYTDDGGRTWRGSNLGLNGPYNFSLLVDPEYTTNRTVWWAGGQPDPAAVSRDDGGTWTSLELDGGAAVHVTAEAGVRYVGVIDATGAGRLYRSRDGVAWQHMVELTEALAGAAPGKPRVRVTDAGQRLYVASDRPSRLLVSDDDGASWSELASWDEGPTAGLELWGDRIFHATEETGLHRSDDDGETWTTATTPVAHPRALAHADDGTLFLAAGDGQVWRSRDGADTWEPAGDPLLASPGIIVPATDFATKKLLLVGTAQGVHWSDSAGATWSQLPRFQRFAMNGTRLACTGPCATWDDGVGALDDAWDLAETDAVTFSFEGTSLRVVAEPLLGAPTWAVTVDGANTPLESDGEWLVDDLAMGWHDVTVRVAGGSARLYAVEAVAPGTPLPYWPDPEDTGDPGDTGETGGVVDTDVEEPPKRKAPPVEDCGCGAGGGAAGFLALVLGFLRRPSSALRPPSPRGALPPRAQGARGAPAPR